MSRKLSGETVYTYREASAATGYSYSYIKNAANGWGEGVPDLSEHKRTLGRQPLLTQAAIDALKAKRQKM